MGQGNLSRARCSWQGQVIDDWSAHRRCLHLAYIATDANPMASGYLSNLSYLSSLSDLSLSAYHLSCGSVTSSIFSMPCHIVPVTPVSITRSILTISSGGPVRCKKTWKM